VATFNAITQAVFGTPADQQAEEKLAKEILPAQLTNYEKQLEKNGNSGFFAGSKLSYADLTLWAALQLVFARVEGCRDQLLGAFLTVKKLVDGVSERERIKAHVARDGFTLRPHQPTCNWQIEINNKIYRIAEMPKH